MGDEHTNGGERIRLASLTVIDDDGAVTESTDVLVTPQEFREALDADNVSPFDSGLLAMDVLDNDIAVFTFHPDKILGRETSGYVVLFARRKDAMFAMRAKEGSRFFALVNPRAITLDVAILSCDPELATALDDDVIVESQQVEIFKKTLKDGEEHTLTTESTVSVRTAEGGRAERKEQTMGEIGLDPNGLYCFTVNGEDVTLYDLLGGLQLFSTTVKLGLSKLLTVEQGDVQDGEARQPRRPYLLNKNVMVATDPVSGALFDPGRSDYIDPAEWWDETPKEIKSSRYGHIATQLKLPTTVNIEDDPTSYGLTAKERYWHETAETLARDGYTVIRGSDLLKKNGFLNPYRKEAADVMKEAARVMYDLTGRRIAIDTTDQYKHGREGATLRRQTTLRPIIDGEYSFTEWDDDSGAVRDFEVELRGDNPEESFPLLEYQLEHKMFSDIPGDDDCLDGLRLTLDHRVMWREVRRRMLSHELSSNRIRFDTLFKSLGMTDTTRAAKAKRERMLDQLDKMLRRACSSTHKNRKGDTVNHTRLFKSFKYLTNNGRRYGIEITPLDE